jgi:Protein of unknown function (DUF559)
MRDVQIAELAGRQFNRVSVTQLEGLGLSKKAILHRVAAGRLVIVETGVLAVAPVRDDDEWGRWMGATLTAPGTVLTQVSGGAAWGFWSARRDFETVTRPGSGGPRRYGGVLVFRSTTLDGECTTLRGIPITTPERTLIDIARSASRTALARAVREAIRLERTNLHSLVDAVGAAGGRRGTRALSLVLARYSGLPLERARSGAEVRALEVLRDAGRPLPELNRRRAGEEADLSWESERLIIEIDGGPFHLDVGEDARKQACWEGAGWTVRRLPSDAVHEAPERLLALVSSPNVPNPLL